MWAAGVLYGPDELGGGAEGGFYGADGGSAGPRWGTDVRLIVDRSSVEAFAQGGRLL